MGDGGHKGWHSRGYLPHLDAKEELQSLTIRLGDALPLAVVERWKAELEEGDVDHARSRQELEERIARFEDAGHGDCLLGRGECAEQVQSTLLFFDADRYRLLEWCVMPNHAHVLIKPLGSNRVGEIVKSWKTFTAREINRITKREGALWAVDYHDRYIRNEEHLANARRYIRRNPVAARLCREPEEWRWSSAWNGVEGVGGD